MGVKPGLRHLGKSTDWGCVNTVPERDRYWDQKKKWH